MKIGGKFTRSDGTEKASGIKTGHAGQSGGLVVNMEMINDNEYTLSPEQKASIHSTNLREFSEYQIFVYCADKKLNNEDLEIYTDWTMTRGATSVTNYRYYEKIVDSFNRTSITERSSLKSHNLANFNVRNKTSETITIKMQIVGYSTPSFQTEKIVDKLDDINDNLKNAEFGGGSEGQHIQGQDLITLDSQDGAYPSTMSITKPIYLQSFLLSTDMPNQGHFILLNGTNGNEKIVNVDGSNISAEKLNDIGDNGILKIGKYNDADDIYTMILSKPIYLPHGISINIEHNANTRIIMSVVYFNEVE